MEYNTARADESEEATRAASALRAELAAAKVREADLEAQVLKWQEVMLPTCLNSFLLPLSFPLPPLLFPLLPDCVVLI